MAVPRGREIVRTLKCRTVIERGRAEDLLEFLVLWRDRVQWIVDLIWNLPKVPSESQLHQLFYNILRQQGFRAHHVKQIYKYARAVVAGAKANKGSKPILRKLTARLDKYDYKLDLERGIVVLKLHKDRVVILRLLHRKEYLERYKRGWQNYELIVKCENGTFWVCIYFKRRVEFYIPLSTLVIDVNLWSISMLLVDEVGDRTSIRFVKSPFEKYLRFKWRAHLLQMQYSKTWRFSKSIFARVRYWFRRARNVLTDHCWKLAKQIALYARKNYALVIIEKLEYVTRKKSGWKLAGFCYRKFLHALKCKCEDLDVPYIEVDPKNTSKTCPICGSELVFVNYRLARCIKCGFTGHRDIIAVLNLYKKVIGKIAPLPYILLYLRPTAGVGQDEPSRRRCKPKPDVGGKE
ncbi:MAG: IS200/IS605 family element transposase accessory protein TnpB [Crenarchaeota archaeon]|nr:IS200/IS605 family element transposase accessory protein TnpB [Thermoproteota archaeon]